MDISVVRTREAPRRYLHSLLLSWLIALVQISSCFGVSAAGGRVATCAFSMPGHAKTVQKTAQNRSFANCSGQNARLLLDTETGTVSIPGESGAADGLNRKP